MIPLIHSFERPQSCANYHTIAQLHVSRILRRIFACLTHSYWISLSVSVLYSNIHCNLCTQRTSNTENKQCTQSMANIFCHVNDITVFKPQVKMIDTDWRRGHFCLKDALNLINSSLKLCKGRCTLTQPNRRYLPINSKNSRWKEQINAPQPEKTTNKLTLEADKHKGKLLITSHDFCWKIWPK